MKITGQTTLAELQILRGERGVKFMRIDYNNDGRSLARVRVALFAMANYYVVGTGVNEIEALDDAFTRLFHREAHEVFTQ